MRELTRMLTPALRLLLPLLVLTAVPAWSQDTPGGSPPDPPGRPAPEPPPLAPEVIEVIEEVAEPAADPETPDDRPAPETPADTDDANTEPTPAQPDPPVFGHGNARTDRRPVKDELVTLNLKEVKLEDLFDFIAIETGKIVMPIGQRIGGAGGDEFTIIADEPVPRSEALDLIFSYLRMNEIGIIERSNVIFIGKIMDMRDELGEIEVVPPSVSLEHRIDRGTLVFKIFQVERANAETIVANLETFYPADYAKISGDSLSNQILLLGDVGLAQQIGIIIREQDHLWLDDHIRTFRLKWADATEIETNVLAIFEEGSTTSGTRTGSSRTTNRGGNNQRPATPRTGATQIEGRQRVELRTTVNAQQNTITIEAERDVLEDIGNLILTQWDLPRPDGTSRLFILKYSDPIKVRDLLQTVLGAGGGGNTGGSARGGASNRNTQGAADATTGIAGVYNIEAFPDRNALLVLAKTVESFDFIERIIEQIDEPTDVGLPVVIALKYANAVELSDEINILLARAGARVSMPRPDTGLTAEGFSAQGDSSSGINISGPETTGGSQDLNFPWQTGGNEDEQSAESTLIGKVRVVPIVRQNALAVLAPPAYLDSMTRLIHSFDRPRRQVMISATIVEVELGDQLNLGVKIGKGINATGNGVFTGVAAFSGQDYWTQYGDVDVTNPLHFFFDNLVKGSSAVLSVGPFDVNLIVEALNTITNTRVIQEPRVFTADNEEAVFFSGLEFPVVSSITDSASAGLNTQTSVEYKNVGVFLNVRPRITEEGAVDLTVTLELSAVGPSATITSNAAGNDTVNSQIFTRKQVSTHVILLDGQTIVIGGLLKESENVLKTKIPLLGDIPFLGQFFTHTEESLERTELIAFLTPTVVHRPMDNYSNYNVQDLGRLEAVAAPLAEQLRDEQALIDLNIFERITAKSNIQPPDRDPLQTTIDELAPDTSLLRRLTPQDDETRQRLHQIEQDQP